MKNMKSELKYTSLQLAGFISFNISVIHCAWKFTYTGRILDFLGNIFQRIWMITQQIFFYSILVIGEAICSQIIMLAFSTS